VAKKLIFIVVGRNTTHLEGFFAIQESSKARSGHWKTQAPHIKQASGRAFTTLFSVLTKSNTPLGHTSMQAPQLVQRTVFWFGMPLVLL
jgi:hypothetical protein